MNQGSNSEQSPGGASLPSPDDVKIDMAARRRGSVVSSDSRSVGDSTPILRGALSRRSSALTCDSMGFRDLADDISWDGKGGEDVVVDSIDVSKLADAASRRNSMICGRGRDSGAGGGMMPGEATAKDVEAEIRALSFRVTPGHGSASTGMINVDLSAEKAAGADSSPPKLCRRFRGGVFLSVLAFAASGAIALVLWAGREAYAPDIYALGGFNILREVDGRGNIELRSYAFEDGELIPRRYTADGADISPPLSWSNLPQGTRSLVLICDAPPAQVIPGPREDRSHWVVYDVPPLLSGLNEGIPPSPTETAFSDAIQGFVDFHQGPNSWGNGSHGYKGPDPSRSTGVQRYVFRVFALDGTLELDPSAATRETVVDAMRGVTILDYGELVGTYERS